MRDNLVYSCKSFILLVVSLLSTVSCERKMERAIPGISGLETLSSSKINTVQLSSSTVAPPQSVSSSEEKNNSSITESVISSNIELAVSDVSSEPVLWKFIALGDSRGSVNGVNEAALNDLKDAILSEGDIEFILFPGDMTSQGFDNQEEFFYQLFVQPLTDVGIEFYGVAGNHEYGYRSYDDDGNVIETGDFSKFKPLLPKNGPTENGGTYSFTYNNALFLGFDWYSDDLEQEWVDAQIAAAKPTHIFSMAHMPLWKTQHNEEFDSEARDTFINTITAKGGRAFFSGHDHFYDHSKVLSKDGIDFHQFIVGTAGAPLRSWSGEYGRADAELVLQESSYGYAVVTVFDNLGSITFKKQEGSSFIKADSYTYKLKQ